MSKRILGITIGQSNEAGACDDCDNPRYPVGGPPFPGAIPWSTGEDGWWSWTQEALLKEGVWLHVRQNARGGTSLITNWAGTKSPIASITKGSPTTITMTNDHGRNGESPGSVFIAGLSDTGLTALNGKQIGTFTGDATFTVAVDTTSADDYTSGGTVTGLDDILASVCTPTDPEFNQPQEYLTRTTQDQHFAYELANNGDFYDEYWAFISIGQADEQFFRTAYPSPSAGDYTFGKNQMVAAYKSVIDWCLSQNVRVALGFTSHKTADVGWYANAGQPAIDEVLDYYSSNSNVVAGANLYQTLPKAEGLDLEAGVHLRKDAIRLAGTAWANALRTAGIGTFAAFLSVAMPVEVDTGAILIDGESITISNEEITLG